MKTSLRRLRGFALHKHDAKDRRDLRPLPQLDELAQASQVRRRPPPLSLLGDFTTTQNQSKLPTLRRSTRKPPKFHRIWNSMV